MKEKTVLRWVVALSVLIAAAFASASDRPEPNAFLNKKADTVPQLIREVRSDSEVADRYERHFGKSREELIQYLGELHLARLNADGTYMIYAVDDNGIIKARPQRLKAGTRVFADASGMPVLKASCGNAMVPGSNALSTTVAPSVGQATSALHTIPVTTPESIESITQMNAALVPGEPAAIMPIIPGQVSTGNSNQGFVVPAALAALGGAGAILIGGRGSHPVPEPATILVMVSALAALRCRRKDR